MTDYEADLAAIGKAANTQIAQRDTIIQTMADERETFNVVIDGLKAQNAKLASDLKACQEGKPPVPPEPPTPSLQLIGSSTGKPIPGYAETDLSTIRVYLQPGDQPHTWDADSQVKTAAQNCKLAAWVSGKDKPDAWLDDFFKSWGATGKHLIYTQNHEYGNDGASGGFPTDAQITEYKKRWEFVKSIASKYAYVSIVDVQLGSQKPADWDKLYIDGLDGVGFDRYNPGIQTPKAYVPVAQVFDPLLNWASGKGKAVYIGETGTGVVGTDNAGRVKWAGDARAYLLAKGVKVACWWNQGGCAMDAATAKAWLS